MPSKIVSRPVIGVPPAGSEKHAEGFSGAVIDGGLGKGPVGFQQALLFGIDIYSGRTPQNHEQCEQLDGCPVEIHFWYPFTSRGFSDGTW
jgi:hypothetical protein